jgi:hypothetical protein
MAIVAAVIVAAVAAVAAGASAYMASEQQAQAAKTAKKQARWQQEVEQWNKDAKMKEAEAARKQQRLKASRLLNAQASKAGRAGVVAGEGSLLANQLEAASLAQYEEDLAAYESEVGAQVHGIRKTTAGFEESIFKGQEKSIRQNQWIGVTLATVGSAASSYSSYGGKTGGSGSYQRASSPSGASSVGGSQIQSA